MGVSILCSLHGVSYLCSRGALGPAAGVGEPVGLLQLLGGAFLGLFPTALLAQGDGFLPDDAGPALAAVVTACAEVVGLAGFRPGLALAFLGLLPALPEVRLPGAVVRERAASACMTTAPS